MTMSIGSFLKGLSLTAILLSVPAFAVFGLTHNASHGSATELAAEHDPLQNGFRFPSKSRAAGQAPTLKAVQANELNDWTFTGKPIPSPTPPGYPLMP